MIKETIRHLEFSKLGLTNRKIQQALGYTKELAPDPFPDIIEQCLTEIRKHSLFTTGYMEYPLFGSDKRGYKLLTKNKYGDSVAFNVDKIIYHQLRNSDKLVVFLSTAGEFVSAWSKQLMNEGDLLKGYIVDVIGSEIVEIGMDIIHDELEASFAEQNLNVTNRYSPGYCEWSVSEQQNLFSMLPDNFIGVTLTSSSLMIPHKSISGFIGVGANVRRIGYGCSLCDSDNCLYRRLKV